MKGTTMTQIKTIPVRVASLRLGTGHPVICVPLTSKTRIGLIEEAETAARSGADLAEWRADFWLKNHQGEQPGGLPSVITDLSCLMQDLKEALLPLPLLFTIRTEPEGGACTLSGETYNSLLMAAAASGADMIDVEVFRQDRHRICRLIEDLRRSGSVTAASTHDFQKTDPDEVLLSRFQYMHETGADLLKMAVMPETEQDADRLLKVTDEARRIYPEPLITMSMGGTGVKTRIIGWQYGSCLTFGTTGNQSAPGQLPVRVLKEKILVSCPDEMCPDMSNRVDICR